MEKLDPKDHERFMQMAWEEAKKARCQKSHFGVVIVKDNKVLAVGCNEPVGESCKICLRKQKNPGHGMYSELCFSIHAEQKALLNALKEQKDVSGALMYIGHIRNGEKQFFERPYCTICSRLIGGSGLKGVILCAGDYYVFLSSNEFNEESFANILEKHNIELDKKLIKADSNKK